VSLIDPLWAKIIVEEAERKKWSAVIDEAVRRYLAKEAERNQRVMQAIQKRGCVALPTDEEIAPTEPAEKKIKFREWL
jgi:hypothetical protein